jgi:CheY-like chemotaxis protein
MEILHANFLWTQTLRDAPFPGPLLTLIELDKGQMTTARPKILCLGSDVLLNRTRLLVLQRCFAVTLASNATQAVTLLSEQQFDLVLLCYSLGDDNCRAIIEMLRAQPMRTPILALAYVQKRFDLTKPDEEFFSAGPVDLVQKVAAMTGIPLEAVADCTATNTAITGRETIN